MVPFQNCVRWSRLPTKMAAKLKIEKRGDEILIVHCCYWFQTRWFLCEFPIGSYVKLSTAVQPSWSESGTTRHKFGSAVSEGHFYINPLNSSLDFLIKKKWCVHTLNTSYLLTLPLFAGLSRVRALSPAWTGSHARETLISRTHLFLPHENPLPYPQLTVNQWIIVV
jgi:hypothetical protein